MTIKFTSQQQLDLLSRQVWPMMKAIKEGYSYNPGDSDLDDEQPIHVHAQMTLGDYRRASHLFYELQNPVLVKESKYGISRSMDKRLRAQGNPAPEEK